LATGQPGPSISFGLKPALYGVNGLNQITSSNSYTFTYDAKGNLTSDGVNSYSYDVLNRLIHGPNAVSFSYDALGRLASTTNSSGVTTQYLYDGQNLVATYDGSGNVTSHYVFGQGADQPVLWYNGAGVGDLRFPLANPQGSIIGVTDVNGNLLAANTYDEYGVPGSNNMGAFQYTGQLWQPDSGLYYYKARIYSPTLGRFLQTDPIGYGD
jgi:YD repeat-containing protein